MAESTRAEADLERQHRRAAIGNERQRHADHRDQAGNHGDIGEHEQEEGEGDAESEQPGEIVPRHEADGEAVAHDGKIEREDEEAAGKAEFLGNDGENEIGVAFRQEAQMALRAFQVTLSELAAAEPMPIFDWKP